MNDCGDFSKQARSYAIAFSKNELNDNKKEKKSAGNKEGFTCFGIGQE